MAINLWAVLVAGIVHMIIGAIWYSNALFAQAWMRLVGKTKEDMKKGGNDMYIWAFISSLVMAFVLAQFLAYAGVTSVAMGLQISFMAWLGFTATTQMLNYMFAGRPQKLYLIDSGYHLIGLLAMGAILSAWI